MQDHLLKKKNEGFNSASIISLTRHVYHGVTSVIKHKLCFQQPALMSVLPSPFVRVKLGQNRGGWVNNRQYFTCFAYLGCPQMINILSFSRARESLDRMVPVGTPICSAAC